MGVRVPDDICWRGVWATSAGVYPAKYGNPDITVPQRVYETVDVPGRNGPVLFDMGRYENVTVTYKGLHTEVGDVQDTRDRIAQWLGGAGVGILRDTYDPTHYRKGYVSDAATITDQLNIMGTFDLSFVCSPQRWLVDGDVKRTVGNGDALNNPTAFPALPLIHVTGSGKGSIQVGGYQVALSSVPDGGVYIDSELHEVYGASMANINSLATIPGGFPVLDAGLNVIGWNGGITSVEVTPRWWTL